MKKVECLLPTFSLQTNSTIHSSISAEFESKAKWSKAKRMFKGSLRGSSDRTNLLMARDALTRLLQCQDEICTITLSKERFCYLPLDIAGSYQAEQAVKECCIFWLIIIHQTDSAVCLCETGQRGTFIHPNCPFQQS